MDLVPFFIILSALHESPVEGAVLLSDFFEMRIIATVSAPIDLASVRLNNPPTPKGFCPVEGATACNMPGWGEHNAKGLELSFFPPVKFFEFVLGDFPFDQMALSAKSDPEGICLVF